MISIRDRYTPTEASTTPPHDKSYQRTAEEAHRLLAGLLTQGAVHKVSSRNGSISIVAFDFSRNDGSLFEYTFTGPHSEMVACLVAVYYWYDRNCVEPPLSYPFRTPTARRRVLERVRSTLPLRDTVGQLLRDQGYQPVVLQGMYEIRRHAAAWVGVMAYAGVTDEATLRIAAGMDFSEVFEIGECMRVLGLSFEDARTKLAG